MGTLQRPRVVSFESRRAVEMAELIRRQGGEPVSAPSMREVPLSENAAAVAFARRLVAGEIGAVVLLTGAGTRALVAAVAPEVSREAFAEALGRVPIVARGPKPVAALRELGLAPTIAVGEPNTWREILAAVDERLAVAGQTVAVQEYGEPNDELLDGLRARGATVVPVPVYRWALPEDLGPLRSAVSRILAGELDVALFTSATQVEHLFRVAGGDAAKLAEAFGTMMVASIGPICSAALRRHGVRVDLEPDHPKMGRLVLAALERARSLAGPRPR